MSRKLTRREQIILHYLELEGQIGIKELGQLFGMTAPSISYNLNDYFKRPKYYNRLLGKKKRSKRM